MSERLERRLVELRADLAEGERTLAELQARETEVREMLLRISGAIQMLEEELRKESTPPAAPAAAPVI